MALGRHSSNSNLHQLSCSDSGIGMKKRLHRVRITPIRISLREKTSLHYQQRASRADV